MTPHAVQSIDVRLLGPFTLSVAGRSVEIGSPKHRALLAALLLRAGEAVPVGDLAEVIWGNHRPGNPRRAVQLYVTRLRRILGVIDTAPGGYRINLRPDQVDLGRFQRCLELASAAAERGDLDGESAALADGLAQWHGKPLADVPSDLLQREVVPQLREERLLTLERRFKLELRRGRHTELVGELVALTAQHPLREPFWALLMTALHRSGRRTDALDAYHAARRHLADELGIDPGEELQARYTEILAGGSALPTPRQLPADVPAFVGRSEELVRLDGILPTHQRSTVVCVIAGTAGIGKTALAAHWSRSVADRFPDGQLWLNLRGFDPDQAMTSGQALARLLRALGVADPDIPLDVEDQAGLFRSLIDGRRMLVVLDNAASPAQIRPLLPGAPGCLVLVTSRRKLSGLVTAQDAHLVVLDLLNFAEARQLLAGRLGAGRVRTEPAAVDEIVSLSAGLPLALAIVAERAAAHPAFDLGVLAAELRTARGGLSAFAGIDRSVSAPAARLFRLLGEHPGPDVTAAGVAGLAGLTGAQTRPLLVELTEANLLTEHVPGRYSLHDLMRAYAKEAGRS